MNITELLLSTVRMATPILLVALAELYSERAGLVNIGLDGIMSFGALTGFMVCFLTGSPYLGILAGACGGILVNMIYAYCTFLYVRSRLSTAWPSISSPPPWPHLSTGFTFGVSSTLAQGSLMKTIAVPGLRTSLPCTLLSTRPPWYNFAYLMVAVTAVFFNRTKAGLNYKAGGEYPSGGNTGHQRHSPEILGLHHLRRTGRHRWRLSDHLLFNTYSDGVVAGAVSSPCPPDFRPLEFRRRVLACLLFGFCDALQLRLQIMSTATPYQMFQMIPYVCTLVALAVFGIKKAGPKANGKPYMREER